MIGGIILAFLSGAFISMLIGFAIEDHCDKKYTLFIVVACVMAVFIISGAVIGRQITNADVEEKIAYFEAAKNTYEIALEDENLTGFERAAIVASAMEQNAKLASYKIAITKWWNFDVSEQNRTRIMELTPIK